MLDIGSILKSDRNRESAETRQRIREAYRRYGRRAEAMMLTDRVFRMASVWYAEVYSQYARTWMYRFDYETPAMQLTALHACHSSDILYAFGNLHARQYKWMFLPARAAFTPQSARGDSGGFHPFCQNRAFSRGRGAAAV